MSVFEPASPHAGAIEYLFNVTLIVCAVIFALVSWLVIYSIVRFRHQPATQAEPRQVRGNLRLEIVWTAVPFLILVFLFTLTVRAMNILEVPPQQPDIVIVGHQFWWEVRYPKLGVVTANEIHIPTGEKMLAQLEAADVIHDFWVPRLGRKMDMLPGTAPNHIWLSAEQQGIYHGACAEFCGDQHAWMLIRVNAQGPQEFQAWVKQQTQPVPVRQATAAERGAQLYQQLTCINCHPLDGTPNAGKYQIGPDLNHLATRQTLAAGVLENTPENLARWLKNPQAIKPGNLMPNMQLTEEQVADLVAYFLRQP